MYCNVMGLFSPPPSPSTLSLSLMWSLISQVDLRTRHSWLLKLGEVAVEFRPLFLIYAHLQKNRSPLYILVVVTKRTLYPSQIETPEAVEVFAVNALAPFILNSKIVTLMKEAHQTGGETYARSYPLLFSGGTL